MKNEKKKKKKNSTFLYSSSYLTFTDTRTKTLQRASETCQKTLRIVLVSIFKLVILVFSWFILLLQV